METVTFCNLHLQRLTLRLTKSAHPVEALAMETPTRLWDTEISTFSTNPILTQELFIHQIKRKIYPRMFSPKFNPPIND